MWFTENAWQPMLLFTLLAMVAAMVWSRRLQARYLVAAAVFLLLVATTWFVEQQIVTERERIHDSVLGITRAFQQRDLEKTVSYVSRRADDLKFLIGTAYNVVEVKDDMRVTDVEIDLLNRQTRARTRFRVNATFAAGGTVDRMPTRWEAIWQLEEQEWRMISIIQLDPVSGNVVNDFSETRDWALKMYGRR